MYFESYIARCIDCKSMQMIIKELGVKEIISYEMFFMCSKYTEFVSLFITVTIFILHVRTTWTHFYCLNFRWVIFTRSWFEHFRLNIKRWNTKVSDFCDFTKFMRMRFRFNIKKYIKYKEISLSKTFLYVATEFQFLLMQISHEK